MGSSTELLHQHCQAWRDEFIRYFSQGQLRHEPLNEGPFQQAEPLFLKPVAANSSLDSAQAQLLLEARQQRQASERNRSTAATTTTKPKRTRTLVQGENIAFVCLIAKSPGDNRKSIPELLKSLQADKPRMPKVTQEGHRDCNKHVCLNYITDEKGCRNKNHKNKSCHFAHLDLTKEEDKALPREMWLDLQRVLLHQTVSPHYVQTSHFVTFLTTLS